MRAQSTIRNMSDTQNTAESASETTLASRSVRALLERHGVPRNKHAAVVSEVLGITYSQGNRRLTTPANWALEELDQLAQHYGETLTKLISMAQFGDMESATLALTSTNLRCQIARGPAVHKPRPGALVATLIDGSWCAAAAEHNLTGQAYDIKFLIAEPTSATSRRVAVLDDHSDDAAKIASYLRAADFEAVEFTTLEQLTSAEAAMPFDGFVLDWIIEKGRTAETVRDLIASIRTRDVQCPIIVLTGQTRNGLADPDDVASAMAKYHFRYFTKPAELQFIAAELTSAFLPR